MVDPKYLPIVVSEPLSSDFRRPNGGGGGRRVFGDVTQTIRENLASQISDVKKASLLRHLLHDLTYPPWPGIPLNWQRLRNLHLPKTILNESTCPVIGCDALLVNILLAQCRKASLKRFPHVRVRALSLEGVDGPESFDEFSKLVLHLIFCRSSIVCYLSLRQVITRCTSARGRHQAG